MFSDTLSVGYLSTVLLEDELKARSSDTGLILSSCFFLSLLLFLLLFLLTYLFFPALPLSPSFLLPSPLLPFLPPHSPFPSLPLFSSSPHSVSSAPPLPALQIFLFLPEWVWGLRAWGREPRLALRWERQGLAVVAQKHAAREEGNSSLGPTRYQDSGQTLCIYYFTELSRSLWKCSVSLLFWWGNWDSGTKTVPPSYTACHPTQGSCNMGAHFPRLWASWYQERTLGGANQRVFTE